MSETPGTKAEETHRSCHYFPLLNMSKGKICLRPEQRSVVLLELHLTTATWFLVFVTFSPTRIDAENRD